GPNTGGSTRAACSSIPTSRIPPTRPRTDRRGPRRRSRTAHFSMTGSPAPPKSSTATADLIWVDWWIEQPCYQPYLQLFAAFYYNRAARWKQEVAINYKKEAYPEHAAVLDIERGSVDRIRSLFWQSDTSVSRWSWGYIERDQLKSAGAIID